MSAETVVDCHGHFTTSPPQHQAFRKAQLAWLTEPGGLVPMPAPIGDDELSEAVEANQLRVMRERGTDLLLFSPQASGMEHHVEDPAVAVAWARACNDLVHRLTVLHPDSLAGVAQLPQTPSGDLQSSIAELRRCVDQLGFVGCNLNPDPSGGWWRSPPLTDEFWFPLYDAMVELDIPAMIHVSTSCNPAFHTLGAHYLNADTSVFMQLLEGDLFSRYPTLRFVIPHGGGAVPYHWGRFRGLADRLGRPPLEEHLLGNVYFDTAVYHQPGLALLLEVMPEDNVLFSSEMLGAVRGVDPRTGHHWDDTLRYVDQTPISAEHRAKLLAGNVARVYPRLARRLSSGRR
jgi:4-oxalmesaconate hydratase